MSVKPENLASTHVSVINGIILNTVCVSMHRNYSHYYQFNDPPLTLISTLLILLLNCTYVCVFVYTCRNNTDSELGSVLTIFQNLTNFP